MTQLPAIKLYVLG